MRVIVAGCPKMGHVWIESIVSKLYGLRVLLPPCIPDTSVTSLEDFIEIGLFEEDAIFHQHFSYSHELDACLQAQGIKALSPLRDPYDTFVSLFFYVQSFRSDFVDDVASALLDKPIDHEDVVAFLAREFGAYLGVAASWLHAPGAVVVRYEQLHRDPQRALAAVTRLLGDVQPERLRQALGASEAAQLRRNGDLWQRHIRTGQEGDAVNHLKSAHYEAFRSHAEIIEELGYEVR